MKENRFIEKFQHKTDVELEYILKNKTSYNAQAITASIQLLKDRNGQSIELDSVEKELAIEKEKKEIAKATIINAEKKKHNITDDLNAPELHSKRAIMVFSGLFSAIFGAVLLMYNMKNTDNKKGKYQVLIFGILFSLVTIAAINLFAIRGNSALIFNIVGGGILNEYFWNKFIGKEFKHRKRSWLKPAIISMLITILIIAAALYGH